MTHLKFFPSFKRLVPGVFTGVLIALSIFAFAYLYIQDQSIEVGHKPLLSVVTFEEGVIGTLAKAVKVLFGFDV
ncbi:MAG: hypothetical protein IPN79_18765 [Saprospiraceae bacterium]|nr:hypothetical protein [Saprospiraceae bacterium]